MIAVTHQPLFLWDFPTPLKKQLKEEVRQADWNSCVDDATRWLADFRHICQTATRTALEKRRCAQIGLVVHLTIVYNDVQFVQS